MQAKNDVAQITGVEVDQEEDESEKEETSSKPATPEKGNLGKLNAKQLVVIVFTILLVVGLVSLWLSFSSLHWEIEQLRMELHDLHQSQKDWHGNMADLIHQIHRRVHIESGHP